MCSCSSTLVQFGCLIILVYASNLLCFCALSMCLMSLSWGDKGWINYGIWIRSKISLRFHWWLSNFSNQQSASSVRSRNSKIAVSASLSTYQHHHSTTFHKLDSIYHSLGWGQNKTGQFEDYMQAMQNMQNSYWISRTVFIFLIVFTAYEQVSVSRGIWRT